MPNKHSVTLAAVTAGGHASGLCGRSNSGRERFVFLGQQLSEDFF
jgi:hypothetical protein